MSDNKKEFHNLMKEIVNCVFENIYRKVERDEISWDADEVLATFPILFDSNFVFDFVKLVVVKAYDGDSSEFEKVWDNLKELALAKSEETGMHF